jgi:altronate hydrolase
MAGSSAQVVRLHPDDNVVVAIGQIHPGMTVATESLEATAWVSPGHKIATAAVETGAPIRKYGQIIGFASTDIQPGEHVHVHNCTMGELRLDYEYCRDARETVPVDPADAASFEGYVRDGERVGTRNYIGILSTVNCSATVARAIAAELNQAGRLDRFPNVDGVVPIVHSTGCGMASDGEGYRILQRTLWGYATHPNFAAVLMIGLGCEVNQIPALLDSHGLKPGDSFQVMTIQGSGGTRRSIAEGVERIEAMLPGANAAQRVPVPARHLTLALQCGGSDGYSGITANPALGMAADTLVRHGGSVILSETPEIYGAEHLLVRRAASREVAEKLLERIRWWESYTRRLDAEMNNNPSPGNKAGGLTTILEKSLGAAAKGGSTRLEGVYEYAEPLQTRGFNFMDSPGYDPCSVTGQVASGANLVCFTTGRGSVFGFKPAPSIKLATNNELYRRMTEDMDVNCGEILGGERSVEDMGEQIFSLVLRVASGEASKSEALGFGDSEFIPWQIGPVM